MPGVLVSWNKNSCWVDGTYEALYSFYSRNKYIINDMKFNGPFEELMNIFKKREYQSEAEADRNKRVFHASLCQHLSVTYGSHSSAMWLETLLQKNFSSSPLLNFDERDTCSDCYSRSQLYYIFPTKKPGELFQANSYVLSSTDIVKHIHRYCRKCSKDIWPNQPPMLSVALNTYKSLKNLAIPHILEVHGSQYQLFMVMNADAKNGTHFHTTLIYGNCLCTYDDMQGGTIDTLQAWPKSYQVPTYAIYEKLDKANTYTYSIQLTSLRNVESSSSTSTSGLSNASQKKTSKNKIIVSLVCA